MNGMDTLCLYRKATILKPALHYSEFHLRSSTCNGEQANSSGNFEHVQNSLTNLLVGLGSVKIVMLRLGIAEHSHI